MSEIDSGTDVFAILEGRLTQTGLTRMLRKHEREHPDMTVVELQRSWPGLLPATRETEGIEIYGIIGQRTPRTDRPSIGELVHAEIRTFVCTDDRRYANLKREIAKQGSKAQTTIVALISAAVSATLSVWVGIAFPFVCLGLKILMQVGKNAYCRGTWEATAMSRSPAATETPAKRRRQK